MTMYYPFTSALRVLYILIALHYKKIALHRERVQTFLKSYCSRCSENMTLHLIGLLPFFGFTDGSRKNCSLVYCDIDIVGTYET